MTPSPSAAGLLWVTNIATPYRAPLWSALGDRCDLTVALLADQQRNRQWTVELDRDRFRVESLHAVRLTRTGDSMIYAPSPRLLRMIAQRPGAVVFDGWESPAYLTGMWQARRYRVPVIASYPTTLATHWFTRGVEPAARRRFFHAADAVLTAGVASTEAIVAMGVPRERVVEGFNTVDVRRFTEGAADVRVEGGPSANSRGHRFIYVGQLIPRKNVGALLEAFARARQPQDTLSIVGAGPLEGELRARAQRLGLDDVCVFRGHLDQDELVKAYAEADTSVLPSTKEVWGLVVNEALASGLHAVVSTAAGITPSITGMPGVFPADPGVDGLAAGLAESRARWAGPIPGHPVTRHTPELLADAVLGMAERIAHRALSRERA